MFLAVFIREEVVELSVLISLAVPTAMFFSAISHWNLPREFPEYYANATLRLRRYRGLLVAGLGGLTVSAGIWFIALSQVTIAGVLLYAWFFPGYIYYRYRIANDDASGDLYTRMVVLDDHEDAFARRQTLEGIGEEASIEVDQSLD